MSKTMNKRDVLAIENARIIFRNFSGKETQYNRAGDRNFCVVLDDLPLIEGLAADGWNVKTLEANDKRDEAFSFLRVKVNFGNRPPKIYSVTRGNKPVLLDEETVGELDYADIKYADVEINPHYWEVGGKSGISAYVKSMYVVLEEDRFASKYAMEEAPEEEMEALPFN